MHQPQNQKTLSGIPVITTIQMRFLAASIPLQFMTAQVLSLRLILLD